MGLFEEHFINPLILRLSEFHLRYNDDIFLIWYGAKEEVFLQTFYNCHPTTIFEYQISKTRSNLLETTFFEVANLFHTKIYEKQNNEQSYLHRK